MKRSLPAVSIAIALASFGCGGEETGDGEINVSESALTISANQTGTNNGYYYSQYYRREYENYYHSAPLQAANSK